MNCTHILPRAQVGQSGLGVTVGVSIVPCPWCAKDYLQARLAEQQVELDYLRSKFPVIVGG